MCVFVLQHIFRYKDIDIDAIILVIVCVCVSKLICR